jgi:hypothetical protein
VNEFANPQLAAWGNFYVIVGSSGAALIGIQFVVMTLIADMRHLATDDALSAFGTPTVVHLSGALVVSAVMSAPWPSLFPASVALVMCGLGGLAYGAVVVRRALRQTVYEPVWQDWLWYALYPSTAYATLAFGAAFLRANTRITLFVVAGAALGLLLAGIHNAWDTVTHIVTSNPSAGASKSDS